MDLLGGRMFTMLCPFFENSSTLCHVTIRECTLEDNGWRLLALAIGSSKHKSLKTVLLIGNNTSDEALVDIITSLSMHPQIEDVYLTGNRLATNGCKVLSTLLSCSATRLKYLNLSNNEINDEGIDALVPGLTNCSHLKTLKLDNNTSITLRGWQQLASYWNLPTQTWKLLVLKRTMLMMKW